VALAEIPGVRLVTDDRAILKSWPDDALGLDTAANIQ